MFGSIIHCGLLITVSASYANLSSPTHQSVNQLLGWDKVLPSKQLVDTIYDTANCKTFLIPQSLVTTQNDYLGHISPCPNHQLQAGHLKTIIGYRGDRVVIYGGRYMDGRLVQPEYAGHSKDYFDYSHGVRLVSRWAIDINSKQVVDLKSNSERLTCNRGE